MGEAFWTDPEGLALRPVDGEDEIIELIPGPDAEPVRLGRNAARQLGEALRRWAVGPQAAPAEGFLVYYQHEYANAQGEIMPCPDLGEGNDEHEYTWSEPTVADVRQRVTWIGERIAAFHDGAAGFDRDEEHGRAWVSIFRLPQDVRVWKGYWDELAESPDDELDA